MPEARDGRDTPSLEHSFAPRVGAVKAGCNVCPGTRGQTGKSFLRRFPFSFSRGIYCPRGTRRAVKILPEVEERSKWSDGRAVKPCVVGRQFVSRMRDEPFHNRCKMDVRIMRRGNSTSRMNTARVGSAHKITRRVRGLVGMEAGEAEKRQRAYLNN